MFSPLSLLNGLLSLASLCSEIYFGWFNIATQILASVDMIYIFSLFLLLTISDFVFKMHWQHLVGSCFFPSPLWQSLPLIKVFRPFTFDVIVNMVMFESVLLFVFSLSGCSLFFLPFLANFGFILWLCSIFILL